MSFSNGFVKVAVSIGLINRLTASGMQKRIKNLAEKAPHKLQEWVRNAIRVTKNMDDAVVSSTSPRDARILSSAGSSEAHFKDLSRPLRTVMRHAAKTSLPPKV